MKALNLLDHFMMNGIVMAVKFRFCFLKGLMCPTFKTSHLLSALEIMVSAQLHKRK